MTYDPGKAAAYWSEERLSKARNPLAAVLSFSQPDFVNEAYDIWESSRILEVLGDLRHKRVADVACGVGRMAVRLAQAGAAVEAVDIAAGMLERTRAAAEAAGVADSVSLNMGIATALPLASQSCDAAICAGLMEHLPSTDREKCLQEIARILVPGGSLALVVNNAHSDYLSPATDNPYRVGKQYDSGYFCQLVKPEEILELLASLGFEAQKFAANLHYSHLRHHLQLHPEELAKGEEEMRIALNKDLETSLHPGDDERFADHFVLACKLAPR
jgi:ubiquinone/menaquinone biosynthesis C-methylase UbiE